MTQTDRPTGMRTFVIIWIGQMLSILGTAMTGFGLTIWAWERTGQATALALVGFFNFAPMVLLSPVAGALVDRLNRKLVLILSDIASGVATVAVLILYATGTLQIWHLYVVGVLQGSFQAFQFPAYSAAITMIIPKAQYARASGMMSLAQSAAGIMAPTFAAAVLGFSGLQLVLIIDIITLLLAVGILLLMHIPQPEVSAAGREGRGSLLKESAYGFRYILDRPSLLGLQLVFFTLNLVATFGGTVSNPMVLARTDNNATLLGTVRSVGAIGGLAGGTLLSVWGGPKRKVHGVLGGMILVSLSGNLLMGLGRGAVAWAAAGFFINLLIPIINGSNQAIWQSKVPPDVQGRVFATRLLIAQITAPLAMLLAGPLADQVFEPAMQAGGALAPIFGSLVGVGPGTGMSLMLTAAGLVGAFVGLGGYFFPAVRNAETILPDHDAAG